MSSFECRLSRKALKYHDRGMPDRNSDIKQYTEAQWLAHG